MIQLLPYDQQVIQLLTQRYPYLTINPHYQSTPLEQTLYQHRPVPALSVGELRYIIQQGQENTQQTNSIVVKIQEYIQHLIMIMENNEECRLSWNDGIVRGRIEKGTKISLQQYSQELISINTLIQECRYGVTSKSELTTFIEKRRDQIFRYFDDSRSLKNLRQLYLPELPVFYEHLPLMTQDSYIIMYDSILQKLLTYQNTINQYRAGQVGFHSVQKLCEELVRQDMLLLGGAKTNELIKYSWHITKGKFVKLNQMREKIYRLRRCLINSMLRAYFIGFMAKPCIIDLEDALTKIEGEMDSRVPQRTSKLDLTLGRTSLNQNKLVEEVNHIQNTFNRILSYLTDTPQTIFVAFYQRKLKKRINRLFKIQARLTHLFKLRCNPDYAQAESENKRINEVLNNKRSLLSEKFKQLQEMLQEMKPLNDNKFKIIFQELQKVGIFLAEAQADEQWKNKLINFQKDLLNGYMFDANGKRCYRKESAMERFSRSRVSINGSNQSEYRVSREQVFEQPLKEVDKRRESKASSIRLQEPVMKIDRNQVNQEGKQFLAQIKVEMAEQFMDLNNFKVYLLPKLIEKVDFCLSKTNYSQQPLFLELTGLSENLHLIRDFISPEINQQKISLIFYPKINSTLFTTLRTMMLEHQKKLRVLFKQISSNQIKSQVIEPHIKQFMETRLKYLYVLLQNIDKLEEIAITVDKLNLNKESYQVNHEATYNMVLKLLLAQKQIKVYRQAIKDKMNDNQLSKKALNLLAEYIYPNFIKSLSLIFQLDPERPNFSLLENLLMLTEKSNLFMEESNSFMNTAIKLVEDVINNRNQLNSQQILQEIGVKLRVYEQKADDLLFECNKYANLSSEELKRQRVRLEQFVNVSEGSQEGDLIDQGAKRFMELINQIY